MKKSSNQAAQAVNHVPLPRASADTDATLAQTSQKVTHARIPSSDMTRLGGTQT